MGKAFMISLNDVISVINSIDKKNYLKFMESFQLEKSRENLRFLFE